jgi:hypothetical protein
MVRECSSHRSDAKRGNNPNGCAWIIHHTEFTEIDQVHAVDVDIFRNVDPPKADISKLQFETTLTVSKSPRIRLRFENSHTIL